MTTLLDVEVRRAIVRRRPAPLRRTRWWGCAALALVAMLVACEPAGTGPSTTPAVGDPTMLVGRPSPADSGTSAPSPTASSSPSAAGFPELSCIGSQVSQANDYVADARGRWRDIASATASLDGVRPGDTFAVGGDRSAVIRDGHAVWIGTWMPAPGGWLLSGVMACGDAGISEPEGP